MKTVDDKMLSRLYLKDTAFQDLMQKRIFNILLIATPYDAFMLEEDGRVEEQVYNEYVALNLSSAPRFVKVANYEEAYRELAAKSYDLIIAMPGVDISETFREAVKIDEQYPEIPFVVLTPFSNEVRRRIANEDLRGVDYVFSWLGNVDLIVAIIKLIEDKMNADHDINEVGVQAILFVEDSIRFVSSILPHLFKFLLKQSMEFSTEALNEHEARNRMRGRSKVLFARDYEEAKELIDRYGDNIMGLVTDGRFPDRHGVEKNPEGGFKVAEYLHQRRPYVPVIMESAESENREKAESAGFVFLDKNSKTLPIDLRKTVSHLLGFGDFEVKYPNGRELMRIRNLKELQRKIFEIPDDLLYFYCSNNCISRWLYSRALFPIADVLQQFEFNDIADAGKVRKLVFETIVRYRRMKNRGVVAEFHKDIYDDYSNFARLGQGSMGGKGRGLAFIDQIIKRHPECENFDGVQITIPHTLVICTDVFDEFMDSNGLYPVALSDAPDDEILRRFLESDFPQNVKTDLEAFFNVVKGPLAVRSSSLIEDSHYQPFAGIYSTYMVPYGSDAEARVNMLCDAVKAVYASVFYKDSKAYMNATSNVIDQEKMAVILQGLAGSEHDGYYYPNFSGVGRSLNYYPVGDEKSEEGVVEVAAGLGSYIVDGGKALRFSPLHPDKVLQTSTLELALRDTQTSLNALPLSGMTGFNPTTKDTFNIKQLPVAEAFKSGALRYLVSTFDINDRVIRDNEVGPGRKVVTFANVLKHDKFPLARIADFMLKTGAYEMGRPVEIEFAGEILPKPDEEGRKGTVYWLQIRPIVDQKEMLDDNVTEEGGEDVLLRSDSALGHGLMDGVRYVVYVKPDAFDTLKTRDIAEEVGRINEEMTKSGEPYVLIGPGRWGTSDPSLGIPVRWAQIAGAKVIVECALPGFRIEPSQGTHFFQNLTSFGTGYFTVDQEHGNGYIDRESLDAMPAEKETDYLKIVKFDRPMTIAINGRKSKGIIRR